MTPSDDDFLQSLSSLVSKEIQQCQTMLQTPTIATLPLLSPSSSASSFSSSGLSTPVTSPCATPVPFASVKIEDSEADMGALDLITFQNMVSCCLRCYYYRYYIYYYYYFVIIINYMLSCDIVRVTRDTKIIFLLLFR